MTEQEPNSSYLLIARYCVFFFLCMALILFNNSTPTELLTAFAFIAGLILPLRETVKVIFKEK